MKYYFKPTALRDLRKLPKIIQIRIIQKLDFYCGANNPLVFAEAIKDKTLGEFRFRVGDYRIIFDCDHKNGMIIILAIGHRRDVYR